MATSARVRAAGVGHGAVQRDRQPAHGCLAAAEFEEEALKKSRTPVYAWIRCSLPQVSLEYGIEMQLHSRYWRFRIRDSGKRGKDRFGSYFLRLYKRIFLHSIRGCFFVDIPISSRSETDTRSQASNRVAVTLRPAQRHGLNSVRPNSETMIVTSSFVVCGNISQNHLKKIFALSCFSIQLFDLAKNTKRTIHSEEKSQKHSIAVLCVVSNRSKWGRRRNETE